MEIFTQMKGCCLFCKIRINIGQNGYELFYIVNKTFFFKLYNNSMLKKNGISAEKLNNADFLVNQGRIFWVRGVDSRKFTLL